MPVSVYDRMLKLANGQGTTGYNAGDSDYLPFVAAINLTARSEIVKFLDVYKQMFPDHWRRNIVYALEHTNINIRTIWKQEVGDIIPINLYMHRSPNEMLIDKEWVDEKGGPIQLVTNKERGQHQSYGEKLDVEPDNDPFVKIRERLIEERDTRYLPNQFK